MLDSAGLAILRYDTPDLHVVHRGGYVLCAVSGDKIALRDLKYWSVAYQEAYRGAEEASAAAQAGGAQNLLKG
ncbi:DUF2093 domain-containing protein [Sphingomonas sp. LM7]|uniref:DUF2093 domain-containing protein n=1 Tax=Sphingomonas sp. LM7 TaxID=1938607 RepID=UPI000983AF28|nr:DUF2093 domain-containing protein [Sphingomonas sp. LM7]AQR72555.1 hypothetical protein BXU08_01740 [Sphingomonas sp. LM7]